MNKKLIKNIFYNVAGIIPLFLLKKLLKRNLVIVNYHSLYKCDPDPVIAKKIYRTEKQFSEDIDYFKKHYTIIGLKELLNHVTTGQSLPKNALMITFDDGLRVNYNKHIPILKSKNVSATFFLNNAFIDNKDLHFERKANLIIQKLNSNNFEEVFRKIFPEHMQNKIDPVEIIHSVTYDQKHLLDAAAKLMNIDFTEFLEKNKPYLSSEQIKNMIDDGFTFGGHSVDHPNFNELNDEHKIKQTKESIDGICKTFSLNYKVFATPYHDKFIPLNYYEKVSEFLDITFGTSGMINDSAKINYQRFGFEKSGVSIKKAVHAEYLKQILKKIKGKDIIKRL